MGRKKNYNIEDLRLRLMAEFWQRGASGTSVRSLQAATGLNAGSLYHVFSNQESMLEQSIATYLEEVVARRIRSHLFSGDWGGVRSFFMSAVEEILLSQEQSQPSTCFLAKLSTELSRQERRSLEQVRTGFQAITNGFCHAIEVAKKNGEVKNPRPTQLLAWRLTQSFYGLMTLLPACNDVELAAQLVEETISEVEGNAQ